MPGWSSASTPKSRDIYIADFTHLGVYACRIIVPGMSEIYPIDDLEWENNSVGNAIRPAILRLTDLSDDECAELLDTLNELGPGRPAPGCGADRPGRRCRLILERFARRRTENPAGAGDRR